MNTMLSYEQDIVIRKFYDKLKTKGKIYGNVYITVNDDGYDVINELPVIEECGGCSTNFQMGLDEGEVKGKEKLLEELRICNAIDLYETLGIDAEMILDLVEYHNSTVEE